MLDLIIFALAILATRYISQKHPLLSKDNNNNTDQQPTTQSKQQYQTSNNNIARYIFQICLLISLILFSLSILEVAPLAYLLIIDSSTVFILWYQALLWVQCILLVLHPVFLGVILVTSFCITSTTNTTNTSSPRSSISRTTSVSDINSNTTNTRQKKRSSFIIGLNILWISIKFFMVSIVWRIIRKIVGVIIPYRITRATSSGVGGRKKQFIAICLLLSSMYYMKSKLLQGNEDDIPYTAEEEDASSIYRYISLKYMVSILCSLGMIIASILNGFGCASLPHSNLVGLFLKPTPLSVISKVEDDLKYAVKRLEETRWMLSDVTTHQQSSSSTSSSSSSIRPYGVSKVSATDTQRIAQLQNEILFLENLVDDMNDDIDEMKQSQSLALDARTSWGRVRGMLGVIFSIVLVIRVLVAANSFMVIFERKVVDEGDVKSFNSTRDPLTSLLVWMVGRNIVTTEQYDMFRQATSLILAGILSLSQVNAFFRVIGALGRRLSRICGASFPMKKCIPLKNGGGTAQSTSGNNSNNVALLLSSFIMGCYFLACVTVVKMNLPIEYRSSFSNAVGLDFDFNTTLLNMIFFTSACVTAVILGSLFGIQRNNVERYQLESQLSGLSSLQAIA